MNADRISRLQELLASDPDDPFTRYALALEHAGQGRVTEAVTMLEELRRLQPDYVPAYHQLGILHERQGETKRAAAAYAEGIATARRTGDDHAALEMQEALDLL